MVQAENTCVKRRVPEIFYEWKTINLSLKLIAYKEFGKITIDKFIFSLTFSFDKRCHSTINSKITQELNMPNYLGLLKERIEICLTVYVAKAWK